MSLSAITINTNYDCWSQMTILGQTASSICSLLYKPHVVCVMDLSEFLVVKPDNLSHELILILYKLRISWRNITRDSIDDPGVFRKRLKGTFFTRFQGKSLSKKPDSEFSNSFSDTRWHRNRHCYPQILQLPITSGQRNRLSQ